MEKHTFNQKRIASWLPGSAAARRQTLKQAMRTLQQKGVDCGACVGTCCTFVANSMMTTPHETLDLLLYLDKNGRLNESLRTRLRETVRKYRLNQAPPGDGRRSFLRRTYTCPFFKPGGLGCSISRDAKPYGCLGFNPCIAAQTEGGHCLSDSETLSAREQEHGQAETRADQRLCDQLQLNWRKKPMPQALLEIWSKLEKRAAHQEPQPPT